MTKQLIILVFGIRSGPLKISVDLLRYIWESPRGKKKVWYFCFVQTIWPLPIYYSVIFVEFKLETQRSIWFFPLHGLQRMWYYQLLCIMCINNNNIILYYIKTFIGVRSYNNIISQRIIENTVFVNDTIS